MRTKELDSGQRFFEKQQVLKPIGKLNDVITDNLRDRKKTSGINDLPYIGHLQLLL